MKASLSASLNPNAVIALALLFVGGSSGGGSPPPFGYGQAVNMSAIASSRASKANVIVFFIYISFFQVIGLIQVIGYRF
jgi:hypothetical protein